MTTRLLHPGFVYYLLLFVSSIHIFLAQNIRAASPCSAIRWSEGDNGFVQCGNSAETQPDIQTIGVYDTNLSFNLGGHDCYDPNSTGPNVMPAEPIDGTQIIWIQFDVKPNAGTFEYQIINGSVPIIWELYYSNSPTNGPVSPNTLSGDCNDLSFQECGTSFSSWSNFAFHVPNFLLPTNYYLAIYPIDNVTDPNFSIGFKARRGCGESLECVFGTDDPTTMCSADNLSYSLQIPVFGANAILLATDPNATSVSAPITLGNLGSGGATSGVFTLTYPVGTAYSVTITNTAPTPNCSPQVVSGTSPVCDPCLGIVAPIIQTAASDLVLQCGNPNNADLIADWIADHATATAMAWADSDMDGDSEIVWTNDYVGLSDACGETGFATVSFTVTDECNRTATTSATISTIDTTNPTIDCPDDLVVECADNNADALIATWLLSATATDACDADVMISNDYDPANFTVGNCVGSAEQTISFTATDDCGNAAVCTAKINFVDTTDPDIACPADLVLECSNADADALIAAWLLSATATDACDANVTISNDYDPANFINGDCVGKKSQIVTFTASDECQNTASCSAKISFVDTTAPDITCPDDLLLELGDPNIDIVIAQWLQTVLVTDNCTADPQVTTNYNSNGFSNACGETGSQTVTFSVTDDCGNNASCSAQIIISDTTDPDISCPADLVLECGNSNNDELIAAWLASASATDALGISISVSNNYNSGNFSDACGFSGEQTLTFTATDECNNTSTCTATISIIDTTNPTIDCPDDLVLECNASNNATLIANWLSSVTATDACDADVMINNNYNTAIFVAACGATGSKTIIFTATDDCGNSHTCEASLIITDTSNPTITCPANLTLTCGQAGNNNLINAWLNSATATNNCGNVTITNNYYTLPLVSACGNTGSKTVTFTATDACGNTATCQSTVTLVDTTPPTIACPSNLTLNCGQMDNATLINNWLNSVTASNNCGAVQITNNYASATFVSGCGNTGSQTVTFTATDACGNTATCEATIILIDNLAPTITCPPNLTLSCGNINNLGFILNWLNNATATDNCGTVTITHNYGAAPIVFACGNTGTKTVTFTATDACGNTSTCQSTLIVTDNIPPSIQCPPDQYISCSQSGIPPPNTSLVVATDNCTGASSLQVLHIGDETVLQGNELIITRTYMATDDCGNMATCQQIFTLDACCADGGTLTADEMVCPDKDIIVYGNYSFPNSGNYSYYYVLVEQPTGIIVEVSPATTAPVYTFESHDSGQFIVYGIMVRNNATNITGFNPPLVGTPFANLYNPPFGVCIDISSPSPIITVVEQNFMYVSGGNVDEGDSGGISPFEYNTHVFTVVGGTTPYNFEWYTNGYVRYDINYQDVLLDGQLVNGAIVTIFYTDDAQWSVDVIDEFMCDALPVSVNNVFDINDILDIDSFETDGTSGIDSSDGSLSLDVSGGDTECEQYTYEWYGPENWQPDLTPTNNGTYADNSTAPINNYLLENLLSGWYSVTITDCIGEVTEGWFWIPIDRRGRDKTNSDLQLLAKPNPFDGTLNLYFNTMQNENISVTVFNSEGKLLQNVFKGKTNANTPQNCQFNANELPNGLYIVQMTTETGIMLQQKVILLR